MSEKSFVSERRESLWSVRIGNLVVSDNGLTPGGGISPIGVHIAEAHERFIRLVYEKTEPGPRSPVGEEKTDE